MFKFRPNRFILRAALAGVLVLGLQPAAVFATASSSQADEVRELLEAYHISKPTDDKLKDSAIDSMIKSLNDPYTQYFSPDDMKNFTNTLDQNFVGIGIIMTEENGTTFIEDVIAGSPAESAGLLPGDAVVSVDGVSMVGRDSYVIQQAALGEAGTSVNLGIKRGVTKLQFLVKRASVQLPTAAGRMMGDGIGYLALDSFSSDAAAKFDAQLQALENSGLTSLIIDLRNNGGGYVDQATKIASRFIESGVLAHLKDREGNESPITIRGSSKSYPILILVNGGSASASELLSGALQDYGVAKLVGTKTYGKGVVQQLIPVPSGGTLKVTVEEYTTPNGHKVDKVGLQPDVPVEGSVQQLVEAFRQAGGGLLSLNVGRGSAVLNKVRFPLSSAVIRKEGVWYVNAKLSASVTASALAYDASAKMVVWSRDGVQHKLPANDSHLIVKAGTSYVDVQVLAKWYSDLNWSTPGDGTLTLTDSLGVK